MIIVETLTSKQIEDLFLMHFGTEEYNNQDRCYGYQLSGIIIHADPCKEYKYSGYINPRTGKINN